ncbi:hypothetical protein EYC80_001750 [Monilinia laxa]|uniref:Uncharacterized protein n=1 Tax=Monilinia laxa TaxID=61186 RepID=A0A5N6K5X4_MONLA|nr:hypothetical protein EYC80_001750 [Monilinia laxa]
MYFKFWCSICMYCYQRNIFTGSYTYIPPSTDHPTMQHSLATKSKKKPAKKQRSNPTRRQHTIAQNIFAV